MGDELICKCFGDLKMKQEIQVESMEEWVQNHIRLLKQPNDLEHGKTLFLIA